MELWPHTMHRHLTKALKRLEQAFLHEFEARLIYNGVPGQSELAGHKIK